MVRVDIRQGSLQKAQEANSAKSRVRRTPEQLLAAMVAKREVLVSRLNSLDVRINKFETRYEKNLKLAELTKQTQEEIEASLEETRSRMKLLRMAVKVKQ